VALPGTPTRDCYLIANRWMIELALLAVNLHVLDPIPARFDRIHWACGAIRRPEGPHPEAGRAAHSQSAAT
jgi:hypothetical protein